MSVSGVGYSGISEMSLGCLWVVFRVSSVCFLGVSREYLGFSELYLRCPWEAFFLFLVCLLVISGVFLGLFCMWFFFEV